MALPEMVANSAIPGEIVPLVHLAVAVTTSPTPGTEETWTMNTAAPTTLQGPGQFRGIMDNEIILVIAGQSGTSWTVIRGAEPPYFITPHAANAPFFHTPTAGALANLLGGSGLIIPGNQYNYRGVYSGSTPYAQGDGVDDGSGNRFISNINANTGNAPDTHNTGNGSGTQWTPVQGATGLTQVAIVSADHNANPGDIVVMDATSGNKAVNLPTTPPDGTMVNVQMSGQEIDPTTLGEAVITLEPTGSDNLRLGSPYVVDDLYSPTTVRYDLPTFTWDIIDVSHSRVGLDNRYVSYNNPGPVTGPLVADVLGTSGSSAAVTAVNFWGALDYVGPPVNPGPWPDGTWHPDDAVLDATGAWFYNNQGVWVGGGGGIIPPPSIVAVGATNIAQTTAELYAYINPQNNAGTQYQFEWGTSGAYGNTIPGSPGAVGSDNNVYAVTANLTGLTSGVTYHFRINTIVGGNTFHGLDQTFPTLGASPAPTITGSTVATLAQTSAILGAQVNANGVSTSVVFQLGLTTSYGTNVSPSVNPMSPVTNTFLSPTAQFTGLTPGDTYNWRCQATNANGTTNGPNQVFTTPTGGAPVDITPPAVS